MPDDIAERFMRDLPKTLAKIAAYRKGVANLEAKLQTLPLQSLGPDDVKTMFEALFRVTSDSLTMAEQAIGRLQAERNETQATVAKLTRELAPGQGPAHGTPGRAGRPGTTRRRSAGATGRGVAVAVMVMTAGGSCEVCSRLPFTRHYLS